LSCHGFQGPQSSQDSQTFDWNASSLRMTFHQTWSPSDIVCRVHLECTNTWALMPVLKWAVFRMVCKVRLEGRGPTPFHWSSTSCPLAYAYCFLMTDAKNLDACTFKEDERACISGLLSNWQTSFISSYVRIMKSHWSNSVIQFIFSWSQFCHSVQIKLFY
jgi:hypothetical protein